MKDPVSGSDACGVADRGYLRGLCAPTEDVTQSEPGANLSHREGHLAFLFGAMRVLGLVDRLAKVRLELVVMHICIRGKIHGLWLPFGFEFEAELTSY